MLKSLDNRKVGTINPLEAEESISVKQNVPFGCHPGLTVDSFKNCQKLYGKTASHILAQTTVSF